MKNNNIFIKMKNNNENNDIYKNLINSNHKIYFIITPRPYTKVII